MSTFGQEIIRRRDLRIGVILPLVRPLGLRGELVGGHLGDDARGSLPRELVLFALQIGCVAQERHVRSSENAAQKKTGLERKKKRLSTRKRFENGSKTIAIR